ncbi:MAG: fructose-6-phosphate aldolase [Bacteroidia bacterium]|nr:fructose-6-phosphate aldolase [Bacteroidia bacterium]
MYFIKIKGKAKIPDYIQVRDETLALIAYFRADHIENGLKQIDMPKHNEVIKEFIKNLEYGKLSYLKLS